MPLYVISDNNPNDGIGGGGCVCSPTKDINCKGPYAIFPASETDSNLSPHVVLSLTCAKGVLRASRDETKIVSAGEKDTRALADEDEVL